MAHLDLQGGQVAEVRGVVAGKGVSADVGNPSGEACRTAQLLPAAFPVARDGAVIRSQRAMSPQGYRPAATGLADLRADDDLVILPAYIACCQSFNFCRPYAAVKHQVQGETHRAVRLLLTSSSQLRDLIDRERRDGLFLDSGHLNAGNRIRIAPFLSDAVGKNTVQDDSPLHVAALTLPESRVQDVPALRCADAAQGQGSGSFYFQNPPDKMP